MTGADRPEVAELICVSTNLWYQAHGRPAIFPGGPSHTGVFADVYEALDPGCCILAEDTATGRIMGSCFYHPRPTHVSLGIMNVRPDCAGRSVGSALLRFITDFADRERKPVRLVSSALNLDSFSLYTRAGFVPRCVYQDLWLAVPLEGLRSPTPDAARVRDATPGDVAAMAALELEVAGIRRDKDYLHFIENRAGFWHAAVLPSPKGGLDGWIVSSAHPALNMIGPGVARDQTAALALLLSELDRHRGRQPLFLVPVDCAEMVRHFYARGARNCELHLAQVRGAWQPFRGVTMPTFLPETA
jgi:GNAT superfamily N-acetyltransferase